MAKRGAKGKYTKELAQEISKHIENGMYAKDAAAIVDVSEATYYRWLQEHENFKSLIKKAEGKYKRKLIDRINKAADSGTWQAAMEMLKRRFPDDYSERREVTGPKGSRIEINVQSGKQKEKLENLGEDL